jgi:hypothetical protein
VQALQDATKQEDTKPEPMEEDTPVAPKPSARRPARSREGGWEVDPVAAAELAATEAAKNGSADAETETKSGDRDGPKAPKRRMRGRKAGEEEDLFKETNDGAVKAEGGDVDMKDVDGAARGKADDEDKAHVLFELQKGLGRGLAEALVIVRERGWLNEVEYRGRISDFKHNQRDMVRSLFYYTFCGVQARC